MRVARAVLGLVATASLVAGCGLGEAGMGLPHQSAGLTFPGERQELRAVLEVAENGCLLLALDGQRYFVVWPAGAVEADRVRLPNGEVVREGDTIIGTGAFTPTAPWVTHKDDYWSRAVSYCASGQAEMVVLDSARRAT